MSCNGCKANVENTLSKLDGVEEVFADLQASEVHVSSARDYRMEQLQQEMDRAGLHYTLYAPGVELKEPERPEMGAGVYYCPMHCEGDKVKPSRELQVGDEVVVSGAQLLLSEELKFQIRNENED